MVLARSLIPRAFSMRACVLMLSAFVLTACDVVDGTDEADQVSLALPEKPAFITDTTKIAQKTLYLLNDGSGCKLQLGEKGKTHWLKPTASCYFVKSPGSQRAQVYQYDANTRIIAVVGTPTGQADCGREVQGLLVNAVGHVRLSDSLLQGSVYCAANGLDNYQYTLFMP